MFGGGERFVLSCGSMTYRIGNSLSLSSFFMGVLFKASIDATFCETKKKVAKTSCNNKGGSGPKFHKNKNAVCRNVRLISFPQARLTEILHLKFYFSII